MLKMRLEKFRVAKERLDALAGKLINKNDKKMFLHAKNVTMAETHLRIYLKNCYFVNEKIYSTAREILDYFCGLTELRYPNEKYFIEAIHKQDNEFRKMVSFDEGYSINPICLTGRSGDGKSELMSFVYNLFDGTECEIENAAGRFSNVGWDRFSAEGCASSKAILSKTAFAADGILVSDYSKLAYANGLIGFGVDELQFTTKSKAANSKITALLLDLRACSVPWIYVCNYSLLWKLLGRNQEDLARIIPKVINFSPFNDETRDLCFSNMTRYLEAIIKEVEEIFPNDIDELLSKIPVMTASSPRYARDLIAIANKVRFDSKQRSISADHLDTAFSSTSFATQRAEVEMLNYGSDYLCKKGHFDLVLPPQFLEGNTVNDQTHQYTDDYRVLEASLTRSEIRKFRKIENKKGKNVVTLRESTKAERLKAGYRILDSL